VQELQRAVPGAHLHLVVGADVAPELHTWARVDELRAAVTLVIVDRGGVAAGSDPPGWQVEHLAIPAIDLSSSDLRRRLAQGRPVDFLVPEPAIRCIRRLDLYAGSR
jgi:nicotinate-nucleotide adenylyltransferase